MFAVEKFERPHRYDSCDDVAGFEKSVKSIALERKVKNLQQVRDLKKLETIYFFSTVLPQELATVISECKPLKNLILVGVRKIEAPIQSDSLLLFSADGCSGLKDLTVIGNCQNLKYVKIVACIKLASLKGLEKLNALRELEITGAPLSMGTLDSLKILRNKKQIEYVSLATRVHDSSLQPISTLTNLKRFWTSNRYTDAEYERVLKGCAKLKEVELHNGVYTRDHGFVRNQD